MVLLFHALSLPLMGQDLLSPFFISSCPAASLTDLPKIKSTACTSRGQHKRGPHAHRAITSEHEVRGRMSNRDLYICGSRVESRPASVSPVCCSRVLLFPRSGRVVNRRTSGLDQI